MKRIPPVLTVLALVGAALVVTASQALATPPLPATSPSNTGMVDLPGASGSPNSVSVRTITQAGRNVWLGGVFNEIDDGNGNKVADAGNLGVLGATTGILVPGVHLPIVTSSAGVAEVFDSSLGPDGLLYVAGNFDAVDGQTRHNVAAIDPTTGALQPFAPIAASANAVLATADAIYVGTAKLLSFQLNGTATPGYDPPQVYIDASLRGHDTFPAFRDIQKLGNTLVAACQCDNLTDANGTRNVKAVVETNATTGDWVNWIPSNLPGDAPFGISVIVHNYPGTSDPTVYLAAGGSDFTAAWDFVSGANRFKTDTSGSSQAITWWEGELIVGGHFEWTQSPSATACGSNDQPNTDCYFTPKLVAMDASNGHVILDASSKPWNPGICCRYNGLWALVTGNDGSMLHVGGEFTQAGGVWCPSHLFQSSCLSGKLLQQYYARFAGPAPANQTLTVADAGTGFGTVTSDVGGISCGPFCATDVPTSTTVTLTAAAGASSTFTGWSSADPGVNCPGVGTCALTMSQARSVTATFAPISYQLTVTKAAGSPPGTGTVTSAPAGISCTTSCSAASSFFVQNTLVTLSAAPGPNATFTGWSGEGCTGLGTCQVSMTQARNVSATFTSTSQSLAVVRTGGGQGAVLSSPTGINCGGTCTHSFTTATVTLTASAAGGSAFNGWSSGDTGFSCPGIGPCTVTMDMARTVNADFEPAKTITVNMAGTGGGTVTSSPPGITCTSGACSAPFVSGATVTLTATANATSVFQPGWTNGSCGGTGACVLTASGTVTQRTVTATFGAAQTLTVTPAGTGSGTITSSPAGINCGLTCQTNLQTGTSMSLQASPDTTSSSFTGWGGDCSGAGSCMVTMNQARNVTATFISLPRQLSVSITAGDGTVTSAPVGSSISCATGNTGACSAGYDHGSNVELDVTPDPNWAFTGWGGSCNGTDGFCVVSMNGDQSVTATFAPINRTVDVSFDGNGTGSVDSTPAGISCPSACTTSFQQGASVTLHPTPDPGSVFTGWSGSCTDTSGDCVLTVDGAKSVVADFEPQYLLTVGTSGSGSVTSDVGGIDCPGNMCSASLAQGSTVTLTATPANGAVFDSWGGGCSGTDPVCILSMASSETVTASFAPAQTLSVSTTGGGSGTVASAPTRINCVDNTGSCSASFSQDSLVTLTATPGAGSVFTGWAGGGCDGSTAPCSVTMAGDQSVGANFEPTHVLTVQTTGGTAGSVTSTPAGIACPGTCSAGYQEGTTVTLTATSGAHFAFTGWSDDCSGASTTCQVTVDAAKNVTATFTQNEQQLTVMPAGTGGGTVTSSPAGVSCPSTCSAWFANGAPVTLTASPNAGSSFAGWSGDCIGMTCSVTMSTATNVTATFNASAATTIDDADPSIAYNGWKGVLDASANGGAYRASNVKNDKLTWKSPATTSFTWMGRVGPDRGKASVTIDGSAQPVVDLYAASSGTLSKIYSGLSNKVHTVVIKVSGNKNAASTGTGVTIDAFTVGSTTFQESDPNIQYDTWKDTAQTMASGGGYRSATASTATATATFTGTGIDWITAKGNSFGKASVTIDGSPMGTVDLYAAATTWKSLFSYTGLAPGEHTMMIQVLGTKSASSSSTKVVVDGFTTHA